MYTWRRQRSQSHSILVGVLAGVIIALLTYVAWINKDMFVDEAQAPQNVLETDASSDELRVWSEVAVEWELSRDPENLATYILTTDLYGVLWAKSTSLDLSSLRWNVFVWWEVIDVVWWRYIIQINTLIPRSNSVSGTGDEIWKEEQKATLTAIKNWELLLRDSTNERTISQTSNMVKIQQKNGEENISIRYELCLTTCEDPSRDSVTVTTNEYGNIYYQVIETEFYVVVVDNTKYTIFTSSLPFLQNNVNDIIFVQDKVIDDYIISQAKNICRSTSLSLKTSDSFVYNDKNNTVSINGKNYTNEEIVCEVDIDLENQQWAILRKLEKVNSAVEDSSIVEVEGDAGEEQNESEEKQTNEVEINEISTILDIPDWVQQFRTNVENPYLYDFKAWYSVSFPSKSIVFRSENIRQTYDLDWVNCWIETEIWYYKQESTATNVSWATLTISVCTIKNEKMELPDNVRYVSWSGSSYQYLVTVLDDAWYDFANKIVID